MWFVQLCRLATAVAAFLAGLLLISSAQSLDANALATIAILALAMAVIPYVFTRTVESMDRDWREPPRS